MVSKQSQVPPKQLSQYICNLHIYSLFAFISYFLLLQVHFLCIAYAMSCTEIPAVCKNLTMVLSIEIPIEPYIGLDLAVQVEFLEMVEISELGDT